MMLVVINGRAIDPIIYTKSVHDKYGYLDAIEDAVNELNLDMYSWEIDDAYKALLNGTVYWHEERICFTAVEREGRR